MYPDSEYSQGANRIIKIQRCIRAEEVSDYIYNLQKNLTEKLPIAIFCFPRFGLIHIMLSNMQSLWVQAKKTAVFFFDERFHKQRLVVPTYNNELVGWTARHIIQLKQHLSTQDTASGYVFNIDRFADSKREIVIVTEGVFDAIQLDGVSIQGNSVTPEQAHLIEKLGKRVILCPDRDSAGKELIDQALELGWEVSPGK